MRKPSILAPVVLGAAAGLAAALAGDSPSPRSASGSVLSVRGDRPFSASAWFA